MQLIHLQCSVSQILIKGKNININKNKAPKFEKQAVTV